jgi:hypothetical protein
MIIALILGAPATTQAEPTNNKTCAQSLAECDLALRLTEQELELRKKHEATLEEYAAKLEKQRDAAYERADDKSLLPWYGWVIIGVAGGVILTRGLR